MNEIEENEHFLDGFDVEVISLDQPGSIANPNKIPLVLRPKKRSTRRLLNRPWLLAIVASAALLTILVTPNSFSLLQSITQKTVLHLIPSSTTALPAGYNSFYIDKDIPWATVLIDGKQVHLPRIGLDEPLIIGNGQHLISWRADPFQLQSCQLSIPFAIDDSCQFAFNQVKYKSSAYQVILLRESLSTVPPGQRNALVSTIQAELGKLSTSEKVFPGEQFSGEKGPVTAQQLLRATLNFQLDINSNWVCFANMQTHSGLLCGIDKQDCRRLCSTPWQFRQQEAVSSVGSGWLTLVMTHSSWDYATENGRIVAHDQPIGPLDPGQGQQLLLMRITWDGVWHVEVLSGPGLGPPMYTNTKFRASFGRNKLTIPDTVQVADDPACNVARQFVLGEQAIGSQVEDSTQAIVHLISSSNPSLGCLVEVTATNKTLTTPAAQYPPAYYLIRFGLLLTANPTSYLLRPGLPRADAYELSLVRKLVTLPGQVFTDAVGGS